MVLALLPPSKTLQRAAPVALVLLLLGAFSATEAPAQKSTAQEGKAQKGKTPSASLPSAASPFLLVLGTAQDGGLPHPGCSGTHCQRARLNPAAGGSVASLGLVVPFDDGTMRRYLVDATPDLSHQLERLARASGKQPAPGVDRSPVDGVFLTHAHIGHYLGLAYFGKEAVATRDLPVWCTPAMARFLRANEPWRTLVEGGSLDLRPLAPGESVQLGPVRVEALAVPHRDELSDTVAFRFQGPHRAVLYVPDTDTWESWEPPVETVLSTVDVALVDATFGTPDELPGRDLSAIPHPFAIDSVRRFGDAVAAGEVEIFFTHLNHSNPLNDREGALRHRLATAGFHVAQEGQRLPL